MEHDALFYHLWTPRQQPIETVEQLVLLEQFHQIVCKLAHTIPLADHLGRDKITTISQRFFWPSMFQYVGDYCRRCPEYQCTTKGNRRRVPLIPLPLMREHFEHIALDLVGPLSCSTSILFLIYDYATRYPEALLLCSMQGQWLNNSSSCLLE